MFRRRLKYEVVEQEDKINHCITHLSPVVWRGVQTKCHFAAVGQHHLHIYSGSTAISFFFLHVTKYHFSRKLK